MMRTVVLDAHDVHLVQDHVQGAREVVHDVLHELVSAVLRKVVVIVQA